MRAILWSVTTILILALTVVGAALMIDVKADALIALAEKTDDDGEQISRLYGEYQRSEWLLVLCVSDEVLFNTEESFGEWRESVKDGMKEEASLAKDRLIRNLWHIKRLSGLNFKSIF